MDDELESLLGSLQGLYESFICPRFEYRIMFCNMSPPFLGYHSLCLCNLVTLYIFVSFFFVWLARSGDFSQHFASWIWEICESLSLIARFDATNLSRILDESLGYFRRKIGR